MRRTTIAMAFAAVTIASAGRATEAPLGTVTESAKAFVLRHGTLFPATPAVHLREGDRLITRANGSATIEVANGCTVWVDASTMLTAAKDTCAKPRWTDFDQVRTGYVGRSSSFSERRDRGLWLAGGLYALAFAATLYAILHDSHHHHNLPTSP